MSEDAGRERTKAVDAGIAGRKRTKAWVQASDEATVLDCGGLGRQSWTALGAMAKATVLGPKRGAEVLRGASRASTRVSRSPPPILLRLSPHSSSLRAAGGWYI